MKYVFAFAVLFVNLASFAPAHASIDDAYEEARQKALTPEGAKAIMAKNSTAKAPDGFQLPFAACDEDDSLCLQSQAELAAGLRYAYRGAYTAQRNLAFCLQDGCDGALITNSQLSCAWRIVIAASGNVQVDQGDSMNLQGCIDRLSATDMSIAKAQAATLYRTVYKRRLPAEWR